MAKRRKKPYEEYLDYLKGLRIVKIVRSSFQMLCASWELVALAALADFIFLVLFSVATTFLQLRAFDHLYQLLMLVGYQTGGVITQMQDPLGNGLAALSANPAFNFHLKQVLYHMFLLFVVLFILWCIFEGLAWWTSHKIRKKRMRVKEAPLKAYYPSFVVASAFFFVITLGLIAWALTKYVEAGLNVGSVFSKDFVFGVYIAALVLVWYFGFISYALTEENHLRRIWKSIYIGAKKIKVMLPTILFLAVLYFLLLELWTLLLNLTNNYVSFAFGLLIFIPSITFSRVLFIQAAERLK
ncbi:MAG: hypothetical protein ACE5DM_00015 [Candidatus Nanoarchaeia archaeon]